MNAQGYVPAPAQAAEAAPFQTRAGDVRHDGHDARLHPYADAQKTPSPMLSSDDPSPTPQRRAADVETLRKVCFMFFRAPF